MLTVNGIVKYEAGPPREYAHGPRINVAVEPEEDGVPKVGDDGLIRVWADPDKEDGQYLKTLATGDHVQLLYQERGDKAWYNVLQELGDKPQPKQKSTKAKKVPVEETTSNEKVYIPLNADQIAVFGEIARQNIAILLYVFQLTGEMAEEQKVDLSEEVQWKMSVTAYINSTKEWSRDLVLLDSPPF